MMLLGALVDNPQGLERPKKLEGQEGCRLEVPLFDGQLVEMVHPGLEMPDHGFHPGGEDGLSELVAVLPPDPAHAIHGDEQAGCHGHGRPALVDQMADDGVDLELGELPLGVALDLSPQLLTEFGHRDVGDLDAGGRRLEEARVSERRRQFLQLRRLEAPGCLEDPFPQTDVR